MKVPQAIHYWFGYHKLHSKKNTLRAYHPTVSKFAQHFEDRELQSLSSDEILSFLTFIPKRQMWSRRKREIKIGN